MKKKKRSKLLAVLLVMATGTSLLSGCGRKIAEKEDAETITVYLWSTSLYDKYAPYIQEQLPDINVEFVVGNNDLDFYKFLDENGGLPDIITCCRFSLHDASPLNDSLMDLSTTNEAGAVYDTYLSSFMNEDGSVNWLPVCADAHGFVVNKDLFEKYEIPLPTDYESFVSACQAFDEVGIRGFTADYYYDYTCMETLQGLSASELSSVDGRKWRTTYSDPDNTKSCLLYTSMLGISFVMRRNQQEAIRAERENNAKLETVNTELRQAKQAAEEAFQVAQEANRSKSSFLANMSHDIRTPMNAIIGITSLIRYDAGDKGKVIEYADKIDTSSQHLLGIINDVLDMSKIEAGKTVFKYSDFSIVDFIQELDTIFHSQIYEKKQTFTIAKENIRHEWVNGDRVHLMQIFSNLLSNAIKYTQEGGKIQFLAEECESNSSVYAKYRFWVSDNGMGMSADFKNTIFDAFTRAENSMTNKIQGTGLGMAITRNLVEAMGGTIDVESELGLGSCFEVLIDLKIAEDRTTALAAQEETDEQDGNILQGMRFLCAEDNELNAEILTELLKIEGAECTICENGEEILKAFEQSAPGDYDMILMDVQMPVMNGYEATKAIRRSSHELAKTIPIIAMTANAFSEDIQHSLVAGMNAHVSKPVEMKILEKTIRSIKSGGGGHRTAGH